MGLSSRVLKTCGALYPFAQIFFLIGIQFPKTHNFDEFHYVPSAKQFLELRENQNYEHPPLGKEIMAVGIALMGDRPIGWRLMSTVFGALTLVGMYLWGLALFRDEKVALWIALLTLANHLLYVQARIGMLDTFMFAFIAFGMAAFTATWDPSLDSRSVRKLLGGCGLMLGLATACKWFGVIPWVYCLGCIATVKLFQHWKVGFGEARSTDWYQPLLWKGLGFRDLVLTLVVMPVLVYFVTFIPFYFIKGTEIGFWDLFVMQKKMWEGQGRVTNSHPYMSGWLDWALLKRPIWYAFDRETASAGMVRGVVLLGNPLVMWSGMLALFAVAWGWLVERRRDAFLVLTAYLAFYFCWAVIPRKVSFYYYYYPAGMVLSFAIAYVFNRGAEAFSKSFRWVRWGFLAAAAWIFVYFFPILAALRIPSEAFRGWMWFRSWI